MLVGCRDKALTPVSTEPTPATTEPAKDVQQEGIADEQRAAAPKIPRPKPDASGKIDLGAMTVQVPEGWKFVTPAGLMRRAQFDVPGPAGAAKTVVFFFGKAGAGSVQGNLDRWTRQFTNKDGSAVVEAVPVEKKIAGFDVTLLDVAGEYRGGMTPTGQPGPALSDQRLIAAIVETPQGPYYIKLVGPADTVSNNKAAFDGMLASITPVPEAAPESEKAAKTN